MCLSVLKSGISGAGRPQSTWRTRERPGRRRLSCQPTLFRYCDYSCTFFSHTFRPLVFCCLNAEFGSIRQIIIRYSDIKYYLSSYLKKSLKQCEENLRNYRPVKNPQYNTCFSHRGSCGLLLKNTPTYSKLCT